MPLATSMPEARHPKQGDNTRDAHMGIKRVGERDAKAWTAVHCTFALCVRAPKAGPTEGLLEPLLVLNDVCVATPGPRHMKVGEAGGNAARQPLGRVNQTLVLCPLLHFVHGLSTRTHTNGPGCDNEQGHDHEHQPQDKGRTCTKHIEPVRHYGLGSNQHAHNQSASPSVIPRQLTPTVWHTLLKYMGASNANSFSMGTHSMYACLCLW